MANDGNPISTRWPSKGSLRGRPGYKLSFNDGGYFLPHQWFVRNTGRDPPEPEFAPWEEFLATRTDDLSEFEWRSDPSPTGCIFFLTLQEPELTTDVLTSQVGELRVRIGYINDATGLITKQYIPDHTEQWVSWVFGLLLGMDGVQFEFTDPGFRFPRKTAVGSTINHQLRPFDEEKEWLNFDFER